MTRYVSIVHEDDGGCLYVDATHRRCAADICPKCVNRSEMECGHLSSFRARESSSDKVRVKCTACVFEETRLHNEKSQNLAATGIIKMMEAITRRPSSAAGGGPSFSDYASEFVEHFGGVKNIAIKTATVTDEVLSNELAKPKDKLDAVGKVISILSLIHKTKPDPIDVSSLDVERLTDDLRKYAKELMVTSSEFRDELLADPDVRRAMGVTVIEEFELEHTP